RQAIEVRRGALAALRAQREERPPDLGREALAPEGVAHQVHAHHHVDAVERHGRLPGEALRSHRPGEEVRGLLAVERGPDQPAAPPRAPAPPRRGSPPPPRCRRPPSTPRPRSGPGDRSAPRSAPSGRRPRATGPPRWPRGTAAPPARRDRASRPAWRGPPPPV